MNREELSAELRECRLIKVESEVSGTENCEFVHTVLCHYYAVLILHTTAIFIVLYSWCITRHWLLSASELLFVSGLPKGTTRPREADGEGGRRRRRGTRSQEKENRCGRDSGSRA